MVKSAKPTIVSASDRTVFRSLFAASSILTLIFTSTSVLRKLNVPYENNQSSHLPPDFLPFVQLRPNRDPSVFQGIKGVKAISHRAVLAATSEPMITSKPGQGPVGLVGLLPNACNKFVHFCPGWVDVDRTHDLFETQSIFHRQDKFRYRLPRMGANNRHTEDSITAGFG